MGNVKNTALMIWAYIKLNGHSLDVLVNTLLGGEEGQTASARWGESPQKTFLFHYGCKFLNLFETDHCRKAHEKYAKMREAIK